MNSFNYRGRLLARWWMKAAFGTVAAAGLVAAACGGSSYSGGSTPTVAVPTSAPAAVTPAAGGGSSTGATTVLIGNGGALGKILTDAQGMTLYTFKNDVPGSGTSAVPATIAANWPPLALQSGTPTGPSDLPGKLDVIANGLGGARQVTYNGMPLYTFVNDKAPGDTKGQGLGGVWFAAQP